MVDVPMPRGNPIDERYKDLRSALDLARRAVIEATKKDSDKASEEVLELRHRAYKAWQQLETFLRDQNIIPDEASASR
jgi:hypothetical protein